MHRTVPRTPSELVVAFDAVWTDEVLRIGADHLVGAVGASEIETAPSEMLALADDPAALDAMARVLMMRVMPAVLREAARRLLARRGSA